VIIEMARFKEVHEVDWVNRTITVGPGVINLHITENVHSHGYHYAPDPSSQKACTIGGNVAENSGGPHTLKYGVTVNHVLGVEMVLPDGELVTLGGKHLGMPGPDLLGLVTGSEGTFGIISKIICRLTPNPEKAVTLLGIYTSVRNACESVSSIIRHGIIPAAMEMLDKITISAVEKALKPGFPLDAEAVLIVELDGLADGLDAEAEIVEKLLKETGATKVNRAQDEEDEEDVEKEGDDEDKDKKFNFDKEHDGAAEHPKDEEEEKEKMYKGDDEDDEDKDLEEMAKELSALKKQIANTESNMQKAVQEESEQRLRKMGFREELGLQAPQQISPLGVDGTTPIVKGNNSGDTVDQLAGMSYKELRNLQANIEMGNTDGVPRELLN